MDFYNLVLVLFKNTFAGKQQIIFSLNNYYRLRNKNRYFNINISNYWSTWKWLILKKCNDLLTPNFSNFHLKNLIFSENSVNLGNTSYIS